MEGDDARFSYWTWAAVMGLHKSDGTTRSNRYSGATAVRNGQVEWIRLIRSNRQLRVLDHTITMPEEVVYEYVTATLAVEHEELAITHHGHEIARHPFPLS